MSENGLGYCMFVVDEEPYCFWDWNVRERSLTFLNGIDPKYFEYLAQTHGEFLEREQQQYAALAIRTSYFQALETLFAFIGATVQAPYCIPAWLTKYWPRDLISLLDKIKHRQPIYTASGITSISWKDISETVHTNLVLEDKQKEIRIKELFGRLWERFADDFLDENSSREYNNIKHGFRVKPGGFRLAIGLEEQPGVPAPPDKMRLIGRSEFGSSFLTPESICKAKQDRHHFRLKEHRSNWHPEDMLYGLFLIAMSINNIISYLKILNDVSPDEVRFEWVKDEELYQEPWVRSHSLGVRNMTGFEYAIDETEISKFTKDQIRSVYRNTPSTDE